LGNPAGITTLAVIKTACAKQLALSAALHALIFMYSSYESVFHELWKSTSVLEAAYTLHNIEGIEQCSFVVTLPFCVL
jgi:hypothetical protein